MKLYDLIGPNPRIVRMFMAEKGIEMPKQTVDLRGGENRQEAASQAQPARPDADAGTRRRQLSLRDHRDLRISRRKEPGARDDRRDAGRARRVPDVDAPRRPQHLPSRSPTAIASARR